MQKSLSYESARNNENSTVFKNVSSPTTARKREPEEKEEREQGGEIEIFIREKIEYGSGLWVYTAGGFTGSGPVFFIYPTVFLSFSSAGSPLAPRTTRWGLARSCARNLNPLVIKSGLYATSGTLARARAARAFTYEKVKRIYRQVPPPTLFADQV